ncbi:C-_U-editing enzyme APOBEC-1-like [Python bivittatus]|uniref:C->U-editing enzyme APOBEC-1 n=1 Tax=Python bivittatus TaxID=176946 RepID=A0A9F2WM01_PYTBI|nr:C->U-editing enzyme APOBEC-1-like [Python bivittatus]
MPAGAGWQIEPEKFLRNYTPIRCPDTTYILYEMQWGRSCKMWRNWCTNSHSQHAEINALKVNEEILRQRTRTCHITWFLSWSPCGLCSRSIIQFLKEHPNVTLEIRVAQLFRPYDYRNRSGLRDLVNFGVQISIMSPFDHSDHLHATTVSTIPQFLTKQFEPNSQSSSLLPT